MKARVHVSLKPGVLDPQGKAIGNALQDAGLRRHRRGPPGQADRTGTDRTDPAAARARVEEMCRQLLANPVIENYTIEIG